MLVMFLCFVSGEGGHIKPGMLAETSAFPPGLYALWGPSAAWDGTKILKNHLGLINLRCMLIKRWRIFSLHMPTTRNLSELHLLVQICFYFYFWV